MAGQGDVKTQADRNSEGLASSYGTPLAAMNDVPSRSCNASEDWERDVRRFDGSFCEGFVFPRPGPLEIPPENPQESPEHRRILNDFDDYLLGLFHTYGWRLLMSEEVLQRLAEWERRSPHLLKRLGEELALRSRVVRGDAPHPFDRDLYDFKEKASEELKVLLNKARTVFGSRHRRPNCSQISEWMKTEVQSQPSSFFAPYTQTYSSFVRSLRPSNSVIVIAPPGLQPER